jgi:hypothetical protein
MKTIQDILQFFIDIMGDIVSLLVGLALLGFLWGVLSYFRHASSPDKRKESARFMVYGLISLFVITSVWGLVHLLGSTFDVKIGKGIQRGEVYQEVKTIA